MNIKQSDGKVYYWSQSKGVYIVAEYLIQISNYDWGYISLKDKEKLVKLLHYSPDLAISQN